MKITTEEAMSFIYLVEEMRSAQGRKEKIGTPGITALAARKEMKVDEEIEFFKQRFENHIKESIDQS